MGKELNVFYSMLDIEENFYSKTSEMVKITIFPIYLESQSNPDENQYIWAYHVRIENNRQHPIQLKKRYWNIVDSLGRIIEVSGVGVIGKEPVINPGETYEYTSGTPLSTPSGVMSGVYTMIEPDQEEDSFDVTIPTFSLDSPHQQMTIN